MDEIHSWTQISCRRNLRLSIKISNMELFLVKIWSENSISIPIHPGIIYFSILLFGEAAYQGEKEAEAGKGGTDEQVLSNKPPLIRCLETYSAWQ